MLVSVVVPSFGRPKLLKECVISLLSQDYRKLEIIIVDDNGLGTQNQMLTEAIVRSFDDPRLLYLPNAENMGGAYSRNVGVNASNGLFVALLDNDDFAFPNRISSQVDFLESNSHVDTSIKACLCLPIRYKQGKEIDRELPKYQVNYLVELLAGKVNLQAGSSLLMYRDVYMELGGFDIRFARNQDVEFMIRLYHRYSVVVLNEYLIGVHIDDRSNMASYNTIIKTKEILLSSFSDIINTLDDRDRKEIIRASHLEIAKIALWNRHIKGFLTHLWRAQLGPVELLHFVREGVRKYKKHKR